LIVNPIAGLGSLVGLHGTDGDNRQIALSKGAIPKSVTKTIQALSNLNGKSKSLFKFFATNGELGGSALSQLGINYTNVELKINSPTTSIDTQNLAKKYIELGVDLILFAGGDGTARDIFSVTSDSVGLLGIPCGVKMRSGIFANFVNDVADILNDVANTQAINFTSKEILDAKIDTPQNNEYSNSEFFGVAKTISSRIRTSNAKSRSVSDVDLDFQELTNSLAEQIRNESGTLYLIGPGSSTQTIKSNFGEDFEVRGVDAIFDNQIVGIDLSETKILSMLSKYPDAKLIVGVIGGQGFLFGRGNQQISGRVINRIGWQNITVIAAEAKILALFPSELLVEIEGNAENCAVPQFIKVLTSPARTILCRTHHCYINNSVVDSDVLESNGKVKVSNG
jgi:predicted polyphosphate/ATP-dependent NAD kinase